MPSKADHNTIYFGEISSDYHYDQSTGEGTSHYRRVRKWYEFNRNDLDDEVFKLFELGDALILCSEDVEIGMTYLSVAVRGFFFSIGGSQMIS